MHRRVQRILDYYITCENFPAVPARHFKMFFMWGFFFQFCFNLLQKEKLSAQPALKRHTSLNDLSSTREEQEIEFLRLQVKEQQHVIDDLTVVMLMTGIHTCMHTHL